MPRARYVFVNWEKKDIVSTSSWPGWENIGQEIYMPEQAGRKATKLLKAGYIYYGLYVGYDLTNIRGIIT